MGVPDAGRDARLLLAHSAGVDSSRLTLLAPESLAPEVLDRFETAIARRLERAPVAQIVGERAFWGRKFRVTPDVLDPRPETETLVALALKESFSRALDLGTGSGCILVTLLAERPAAKGTGTDVSERALLVAGENAERHGVADRIVLPLSDWFDDVGGRYDLMVSNPPYVSGEEMLDLAPELAHEPRIALTDEADGLSACRAIAAGAPRLLEPGGRLLVEIGEGQAAQATGLFRGAGFAEVAAHPDLDGRDRVISGRKPGWSVPGKSPRNDSRVVASVASSCEGPEDSRKNVPR